MRGTAAPGRRRSSALRSTRVPLACKNLAKQNTGQKAGLFDFADGRTMVERVIALRFDGVEDGEATAAEHFEIDAELAFDLLRERKSLVEEFASASDQVLHQRNVVPAEAVRNDVVFTDVVMSRRVERN